MNRYKKREDSSPLPGATYIRFSSEMQSDSFGLDAQLRQIKEQAERDGALSAGLIISEALILLPQSHNPFCQRVNFHWRGG